MRQYELAIRIAQVHHLVDERKYKKALAVIQTLDMRQVRALSDLRVFAEVYTKTEQYDAAKATYLRIYRRSHTKRVLYRLIYLSIRTNALNDAEAYYQEFVRMNPNVRDALIVRYRIDKAAGEPIGRLIEILQELKQEEYIEEWAYELAKLYHRAGRKEDCKDECQDIILWFGSGEIVERAKILIEHLEEKDGDLYYDDKDFTVPKKEEPNPEDTGSLPDLNEFIKARKHRRKEERREGQNAVAQEQIIPADETDGEQGVLPVSESAEGEQAGGRQSLFSSEIFLDDYRDDDFDEEMDFPQIAKDGIHKLSGLLKLGKKEEEIPAGEQNAKVTDVPVSEPMKGGEKPDVPENAPGEEQVKIGFVPHSQSGMGITQDLAKEIAAIYEMEQREQLKEKTVTVLQDTPNLAANVVERMTQAVQRNIGKSYIPLDIEEIRPGDKVEASEKTSQKVGEEKAQETMWEEAGKAETSEALSQGTEEKSQEILIEKTGEVLETLPRETEEKLQETAMVEAEEEISQMAPEDMSEEDMKDRALTEMLEEEVAEIRESISREDVTESRKNISEEEMAEANRQDAETLKSLLEEEIDEPEPQAAVLMDELVAPEIQSVNPNTQPTIEQPSFFEQEVPVKEDAVPRGQEGETEGECVSDYQQVVSQQESVPDGQEVVSQQESVADEQEMVSQGESVPNDQEVVSQQKSVLDEQEMASQQESVPDGQEVVSQQESVADEQEMVSQEESVVDEQEMVSQEASVSQEEVSGLAGYRAPDIPVVETSFMEMPEITYDELPTTRALQQSFRNVLKLIAGELDPSHFVLMGDGRERIVGVSKQIVRVMKEAGYLSQGRIAKIHAGQINRMDLISFRSQLRGNCLLVEGASDLLFPTITRLFSIMEEYYGDFVVILVDEGTTLDQLFRFVPALAKKFKYIIDISHYTPEDYQ